MMLLLILLKFIKYGPSPLNLYSNNRYAIPETRQLNVHCIPSIASVLFK